MMDFPHWAARVYDVPLMISGQKLSIIRRVVEARLFGEPLVSNVAEMEPMEPALATDEAMRSAVENGVALIPVLGTLVNRTSGIQAMSGFRTYSSIVSDVRAALEDPAVRAILLEFDSPGGEVAGVFDAARAIADMRGVKPIWAIANASAFSAAYALASATDRISLTDTSAVGSIGVIAVHVDQSARDQAEGLKFTEVTAGEGKADLSSHSPLSDDARAKLEAEVNRIYGIFTKFVAKSRGLSQATVRDLGARWFAGESAVEAGLADAVESPSTTLTAIAAAKPKRKGTRMEDPNSVIEISNNVVNPSSSAVAPNLAATELLPPGVVLKMPPQRGATAEDATEIAQLCTLAGRPDLIAGYLKAGTLPAAVRERLLEDRASASDRHVVVTANTDGPASRASEAAAQLNPQHIYAARRARIRA